jgi:putative nucleotidyltransferase with HDIG domain
MPWFEKLRSLFVPPKETRRVRRSEDPSAFLAFLETNRLVSIVLFVCTVAAIMLVSFVGVSQVNLPVQPNQLASVRIVAADTFSYTSQIRTEQQRENQRNRVAPSYRLDFTPYQQFSTHLRQLLTELDEFEATQLPVATSLRPAAITAKRAELAQIVSRFNELGPYRASVDDVAVLLGLGDARMRYSICESGLVTLNEAYQDGIYDDSRDFMGDDNRLATFQVRKPDGEITQARVQSREDALTMLRINLGAEGLSREASTALFRIFRNGLTANLIFDAQATLARQREAVEQMKPVQVTVERGQAIIEPGTRVTPEQHEMLLAHREFVLGNIEHQFAGNLQALGRVLLALAMVIATAFFIRLEDRATLRSNGRLALIALIVLLNLGVVRATFMLTSVPFFADNPSAAAALPFFAPAALGPLMIAILLGSGPAIFHALLVSLFTAVIYGNRLDLLAVHFLASIIGIYACRNVRRRGRVVRAAFLSGTTVAAFAILIGLSDQLPFLMIGKQVGAALAAGIVTGIVVVGFLPFLEGLFKQTTDITLLELTDYNHPLLRYMQMEAPGTYHHSLMVANLAENAANEIGANALVCRVCSLFHDIGKTAKPEYFSENQRDRANPHDERTPSFSALIIKSHVKEGVSLALQHKLPRIVIDVIKQHHGTTLIEYFFNRAKRGGEKACETTYRYDGPKPQFKESAIIFLADSIEAASRSMRKVTPSHLEELIEQIFDAKMNDEQLSECPITLGELSKIKTSFAFTLLSMLHSRVAYPPAGNQAHADDKKQENPVGPGL